MLRQQALCDAGLFHSIYGTEGFAGYALPWTERPAVRALVGPRAERLAWLFCAMDRASFDATVLGLGGTEDEAAPAAKSASSTGTCGAKATGAARPRDLVLRAAEEAAAGTGAGTESLRLSSTVSAPGAPGRLSGLVARPELGGFPLPLASHGEWLDLATMVLADYLEQVEGAASKPNPGYGWGVGGAWGYRRQAYAALARVLKSERGGPGGGGDEAAAMHAAVYGAERLEGTAAGPRRQRDTPVTPPQTDAAKTALAAIASADL
jgi:hypothetical protein